MFNRTAFLTLALILLAAASCPADTINSSSNSSAGNPQELADYGDPSSAYQGYFAPNTSGYTTPLDAPEFSLLGQTPGSFLFTLNTMYAFNGTPFMSVLSANVDPGQSTLNLNDPTNHVLSFSLSQNTAVSSAPEPRSLFLTSAGLLLSLVWYGGVARRERRG